MAKQATTSSPKSISTPTAVSPIIKYDLIPTFGDSAEQYSTIVQNMRILISCQSIVRVI